MKPILEIRNLGKRYQIRSQNGGYLNFRERLFDILGNRRPSEEDFWALRDVSFQVQRGESIGIVGMNGAGKSTLLKILSKITPPTTGRIFSRGRIASLLEVGTGFHPELSGRENVFFNGSLLGMRRREIESKFDEIVDFSGVERFLDTALKHYSSGMQLRLAFAVAAFLDPEILIIDEVLAVGDAEFQRKCLGKMGDVSKSGRTILFVSHNIGMVKQLCTRCVWLHSGMLRKEGDTTKILHEYLLHNNKTAGENSNHHLGKGIFVKDITFKDNPVPSLGDTLLTFSIESKQAITIDSIGFYVNNLLHERIGVIDLRNGRYELQAGSCLKFEVAIQRIALIEGEYNLGLFLGSTILSGNFDEMINFHVESPRMNSDHVPYPLEVRGRMEFDYKFYVKKN